MTGPEMVAGFWAFLICWWAFVTPILRGRHPDESDGSCVAPPEDRHA